MNVAVLIIVGPQIHEHGMSLHIFRSLISFSTYKSYTTFITFIPKYFTLNTIVNENVFLIYYFLRLYIVSV
jgi:hypothetical protein